MPKKNKSGILIKSLLRESETEVSKQKEIKKYFKKSLQERKTSGNIFNCRQVKNLKAKNKFKKVLDKGQTNLI